MPLRSVIRERSTSVPGCESRSFIAAIRLWPPASALPPLDASASEASASVVGRTSSNEYIVIASWQLSARGVNGLPHAVRRRGHVEMGHTNRGKRIHDGIHERCRRADRARLTTAL